VEITRIYFPFAQKIESSRPAFFSGGFKSRISTLFFVVTAPLRSIQKHILDRSFSLACKYSSAADSVTEDPGDEVPDVRSRKEKISSFFREQMLKVLEKVMDLFFDLSRSNPSKEEADANETPTICVHGFGGCSTDFARIKSELELKNVFVTNLDSSLVSTIDQHARKVADFVEEVLKCVGRRDVNLIGHSMGGVVIRHSLQYYAKDITIKKVITLGSPLNGAQRANWGRFFSRSAKDLVPGCAFLRDHASKAGDDDQTQYFHLAAERDATVFPRETAWGGGSKGATLALLEGGTHMNMLFSKAVADWVGECLKDLRV